MSKNSLTKKRKRLEIQERLLRLFDEDNYEEFHTPKYIFVKQWNGGTNRWQVAIYPRDSWERLQAGSESHQLNTRLKLLVDDEQD